MRPPADLAKVPVWGINLDRRPDRWAHLTAHLAGRGLPSPRRWVAIDGRATSTAEEVDRYSRDSPTGRGVLAADLGCAKSHLSLIGHLIEDPAPWTLIVEDDVAFHRDLHAQWAHLASTAPDDALMILLGCVHKRRPTPLGENDPHWCRVTHATCAHAYMVTPEALPLLHEATASLTLSFDVAWNEVHRLGRTYAPLPHLAIQREDYSDISGRRRAVRRNQLGKGVL